VLSLSYLRNFFIFSLVALIPITAYAEPLTSDQGKLVLLKIIGGQISPKSVAASGAGLVSANNMMYRHSVTFYDAETMRLIHTVADSVTPSKFGFTKFSGEYKGAPVEGAYSPDGKYMYFTNYAMYGKGLRKEGHDTCSPASGFDPSFVSRVNLKSFAIDAIYPVGSVPKVVKVTPDNKYILVTNWCSYTLTVISIQSQRTVKTIKIGAYPRGIVISSDSKYAYVAQMGGYVVHQISLADFSDRLLSVGVTPRALVLSPDGNTLYATLNLSGRVTAYNLLTHKSIKSVLVGKKARSLDISADGRALYAVGFESGTLTKLRSSDLKVLQTISVCKSAIGVTYESHSSRIWVACYGGALKVFENQ
jgi:YVTN family beta-propeller protein